MNTIRMTLAAVPAGYELVRRFGQALLLNDRNGNWRLAGGRRAERSAAREWVSLFCHEALVRTNEGEDSASRTVVLLPSAERRTGVHRR